MAAKGRAEGSAPKNRIAAKKKHPIGLWAAKPIGMKHAKLQRNLPRGIFLHNSSLISNAYPFGRSKTALPPKLAPRLAFGGGPQTCRGEVLEFKAGFSG